MSQPLYVGSFEEPEIDASSVALVVVDMQENFVRPDSLVNENARVRNPDGSAVYHRRMDEIVIPNTLRLLEYFRHQGKFIAFTLYGSFRPDGSDLPAWSKALEEIAVDRIGSRVHLPFTDPGTNVISEFSPQPGELVVPKSTSGVLAGTSIDQALRQVGAETVVITGMATDVCVMGTARELADAGFKSIVVEDATATTRGDWEHEAALRLLQNIFADVLSTDQVLTALEAAPVG